MADLEPRMVIGLLCLMAGCVMAVYGAYNGVGWMVPLGFGVASVFFLSALFGGDGR